MSFVIYDVETTGLRRRFDQIIQFAAVITDEELNLIDQVQFRCRLMPHIIPSPKAITVHGLGIEQLTDPTLPSHYEMVTEIRRALESLAPTVYLGFNSLQFDEELLRQAFYQCLYNPYLTNRNGNVRADVLSLCRLTAALAPSVIRPAVNADGSNTFKLSALAKANGITVDQAHEASADVEMTYALCRHIRREAPEVWSQFLRFSSKSVVEDFVGEEEAFVVWQLKHNQHRPRVVTRIGRHDRIPTMHYCLDLNADIDALMAMPDDTLYTLRKNDTLPIVTVRSNAAPTLWALYEASPEHLAPLNEDELLSRARQVQGDPHFVKRLVNVIHNLEADYPCSPHVEDQLYSGFASSHDEGLMQRFHETSWERRGDYIQQFQDKRFRLLARRLTYYEYPEALDAESIQAVRQEVCERTSSPLGSGKPWLSIHEAINEAKVLMAEDVIEEGIDALSRYVEYLNVRD